MLKLKNPSTKFSIIYESEDMTENKVYDYLLSEKEADLVLDNSDCFILDSETDIEEWEDMTGIYDKESFDNYAEDFSMKKYFEFIEE